MPPRLRRSRTSKSGKIITQLLKCRIQKKEIGIQRYTARATPRRIDHSNSRENVGTIQKDKTMHASKRIETNRIQRTPNKILHPILERNVPRCTTPQLTASHTTGITPDRERIRQTIKDMPNKKAPGPDGITIELIRQGGQITEQMTTKLIEHIWETADIPSEMNRAHICLLPKGTTDLHDPSNHRPISLMNIWVKIIDKIIN